MAANISLQRTAPCGLAAELGSFGGFRKGAVVGAVTLTCFLSSSLARGQERFDQDVWGPTVIATVSLQTWSCLECPAWLIAFLPNRSGLVNVRESNAGESQYRISSDDPGLQSLLALVQDVDPATRSGSSPAGSEMLVVRCNPPGSLFITTTLTTPQSATPLFEILGVARQLVKDAKARPATGGS